jgi:hypothetical protein
MNAPSASARPGNKRLQLILIMLAFAAPVLLAVALNTPWFRLTPDSTRNHGELISPVIALGDLGLGERGAETGEGMGLWTLLWLPDAAAAAPTAPGKLDCSATLDLLRRLRLAEGRRLDRVRIAYDASCAEAAVAGEGQLQLDADTSAGVRERLRQPGLLLVDPYGNAMMRYPLKFNGSAVKKDLDRLLRYSQAGKA